MPSGHLLSRAAGATNGRDRVAAVAGHARAEADAALARVLRELFRVGKRLEGGVVEELGAGECLRDECVA